MSNNSNILKKLMLISVSGFLISNLYRNEININNGNDNPVKVESYQNISNELSKYLNNKLNNGKDYEKIINNILNKNNITEEQLFLILKPGIKNDNSTKIKSSNIATINLFRKKFDFVNTKIESKIMDVLIKKVIERNLNSSNSMEEFESHLINEIFLITTLYDTENFDIEKTNIDKKIDEFKNRVYLENVVSLFQSNGKNIHKINAYIDWKITQEKDKLLLPEYNKNELVLNIKNLESYKNNLKNMIVTYDKLNPDLQKETEKSYYQLSSFFKIYNNKKINKTTSVELSLKEHFGEENYKKYLDFNDVIISRTGGYIHNVSYNNSF